MILCTIGATSLFDEFVRTIAVTWRDGTRINVRAIARPVPAMFEDYGAIFQTDEPAKSIGARMFEEVRLDHLPVVGAARRKRQIERGVANEFPGAKRLIPFEEVIPCAFDAAVAVFIVLR